MATDAAVTLTASSAAQMRAPKHVLPLGAPCPNCETALAGPWCQACGQSSDDFHRSLVRLGRESLGDLIDVDGRIWRTLPDLALRPARLTRHYLDGRRMTQIPPFRLFLIVVVLVFLAAGLGPSKKPVIDLGEPAGAKDAGFQLNFDRDGHDATGQWLAGRLKAAAKDPIRFEATLTEWAQRLAVLMLPMSAALLGLLFFWRRGVFMFDHLIFSMHSLSFQGLLVAIVMAGSQLSSWFGWLLLISPIHLFAHLRGVYGLGVIGTLARMAALFVGSLIGFVMAMAGLVLIGLLEFGQ